ncbi:MAG: flagellar basal body L-ring protein FlgH [Planctomycetota bacterium]|nr:flagellar basal body L-ring protein FlgH [Planctomycetota bacterium]
MKRSAIALAAGAILLACAQGRGESIYARAVKAGGVSPIHTDDTARRVGDLLTVVIAEQSSVTNSTNRDTEKKTSRSAALSGTVDPGSLMTSWWKKLTGSGVSKSYTVPTADLTSSSDQKFEGKNDYDTSRKIADSITVTVYDVLPNGSLVIMGTRKRHVDGDTQYVQISGIVRVSDIAYANTVPSSSVAEFQLVTSDQGQGPMATRPGWLGAWLNKISLP